MATHNQDLFALSQGIALTRVTFFAYILPPVLCLYLMAVLVQLNGTCVYRIALLPVLIWCAWRGAFVDASGGNPKQVHLNTLIVTYMFSFSMRGTIWAFVQEPFYRFSSSTKPNSKSTFTALWDALDLITTTRGIGWNWKQSFSVPKPAFETNSRMLFVLWSAVQLALCSFGMDVCIQTARIIFPQVFGSLDGGALFDDTLPSAFELFRAIFLSFLAIWIVYFGLQLGYHTLAILCITAFQHHPSQWPPLFDSPWLSTSLTELWGHRWHQMLREPVVALGFRPFNYLFGRFAGLLGAFLVSGIFHAIELRSCGRGGRSVVIVVFWVMNGVGVVLERVWKRCTGKRVGGILGFVWMFGWLALWGVPVVNEWAKSGRFAAMSPPGGFEPSILVVRACLSLISSY